MDGVALPVPEAVKRRRTCGEVESRFFLPRPRQEVFAYFADPRNLRHMTPPWLRFRIRTPMPVAMAEGVEIAYTMRWHGLPIPWRSRVTTWEPPELFTYEQARGPYRFFLHEHRYLERPEGTLVVDRAWFDTWGGGLLRPLVERDLRRIFSHRERAMAELLSARSPAGGSSSSPVRMPPPPQPAGGPNP